MTATSSTPRPAAQRLAVLALVAAFVLAQALGWIHRGLHGETASAATGFQQAAEGTPPALFDAVFGSHTDGSDCRLFDVIAQPALASAMLVVLPLALAPAMLLAGHAGFVARWSALFDARGPPHLR